MSESQVIALGFFDGIHLGHTDLLKKTAELAAENTAEAVVLSFDTHPDTLVRRVPVPLINSAAEREILIREQSGIESVSLLPFTEETMRTPWRSFLDTLLAERNIRGIVVGYDFRFGYRGEGTAEKLRDYCAERGLLRAVIPARVLSGIIVSSTHIRSLLASGNIAEANRFLGHNHLLTGNAENGRIAHNAFLLPLPDGEYLADISQKNLTLTAQSVSVRDGDILLPWEIDGATALRFTDRLH